MAIQEELIEVGLLSLGVAALAYLIWFLQQNGMFVPITPKKRSLGPYIIAYLTHVGPYDNIGKCFNRIIEIGKNHGVTEKSPGASDRFDVLEGETMDALFDDPKTTDKKDLRAMVGIVLDVGKNVTEERRKRWESKFKDEKDIKGVEILEKGNHMVADFPMMGKASIFIGVWRVYPKLGKAVLKCEEVQVDEKLGRWPYGSLEFYSCARHRTLYGVPLEERKSMLPFELKKEK